jgi:hypothetical protein
MGERRAREMSDAVIQRTIAAARLFWLAVCLVLVSFSAAEAQWWNPFAPTDYEECASRAAKEAKSKDALTVILSGCNTEFVGRRRSDRRGYTYFDPRQARSFDIEGPNPTGQEWQFIDAENVAYQREQQAAAEVAAEQARLAEALRQQTKAEAQRKEAERQLAAENSRIERERRRQAAAASVRVTDKHLDCGYSGHFCDSLVVSLSNQSKESITEVSLGWAFLPPTSTVCPSAYQTRGSWSVHLQPGDTIIVNSGWIGAPSGGEAFRYCVAVTEVRIE